MGAAVRRGVESSDDDDSETEVAEIGVVGGRASTVPSRIMSRCRARASGGARTK